MEWPFWLVLPKYLGWLLDGLPFLFDLIFVLSVQKSCYTILRSLPENDEALCCITSTKDISDMSSSFRQIKPFLSVFYTTLLSLCWMPLALSAEPSGCSSDLLAAWDNNHVINFLSPPWRCNIKEHLAHCCSLKNWINQASCHCDSSSYSPTFHSSCEFMQQQVTALRHCGASRLVVFHMTGSWYRSEYANTWMMSERVY